MRRMFLFVFVIPICIVASCTNHTDEQKINNSNERQTQVEQTSQRSDELTTNSEIATHLTTISKDVPNVKDAIAIVAGPYAVVGIDIDEETKRQQAGTIKYSVTEALQNDPYGKTSVVIADADIMRRLEQMRVNIEEGEPIHGIVDELAEIVGRYMPTFPVPDNYEDNREDNTNNLSDEEQKELENIQKEQSKR